jgi:hypothetical protein
MRVREPFLLGVGSLTVFGVGTAILVHGTRVGLEHLMASQMLIPRTLLSGGGGADVEHATALNGLELT